MARGCPARRRLGSSTRPGSPKGGGLKKNTQRGKRCIATGGGGKAFIRGRIHPHIYQGRDPHIYQGRGSHIAGGLCANMGAAYAASCMHPFTHPPTFRRLDDQVGGRLGYPRADGPHADAAAGGAADGGAGGVGRRHHGREEGRGRRAGEGPVHDLLSGGGRARAFLACETNTLY